MFKLEDSVTCGESVDVLAGCGWSLAVTAEGTATDSSATGSHPNAGTSEKPLPGRATSKATPSATSGQTLRRRVPGALSQRRTAAAVKRSLLDSGEDRRTIDRRQYGALDTEGSQVRSCFVDRPPSRRWTVR